MTHDRQQTYEKSRPTTAPLFKETPQAFHQKLEHDTLLNAPYVIDKLVETFLRFVMSMSTMATLTTLLVI